MDPNETLRQLRDAVKQVPGDVPYLFGALDEWLSRGGFLPDAWKAPTAAGFGR